jgi:hypothetical protein
MSATDASIYFLSNRGKSWAIWRIRSPLGDVVADGGITRP